MRKALIPLKVGGNETVNVMSVREYLESGLGYNLVSKYVKKKGWTDDGKPDYYLNVPISFDIETSHYDINNDMKQRVTWMYIWQMTVDGTVIMGRTWDDWRRLLRGLKKQANIYNKHKAIIFVQNLAYEYQFIHTQIPIEKIFAREARKVISIECGDYLDGFKFECTYSISGKSLEKLAKDTKSCPVLKMAGDLDYDKFRTKKTILSDEEFVYCVNDVLIIDYYVRDLINNETTKCVGNIPITKTGFVRRDARNTFGRDKEYRKFYNKQKLTAEQFIMYVKAYRGGDTHANGLWCGERIEDVYSFDITSSYPFRIVAEQFPLSEPVTIENPTIEHFNYLINNDKLFIVDLNLTNVRNKGVGYHTYIPKEKCIAHRGSKTENGRIIESDALRIVVTSIDFKLIEKYYDFEISSINNLIYHTKKGYLPKCFRDYVLNLYCKKTELKNVEGREFEYMQSKENVNSVYGMCVTNPLNDEVCFNNETKEWEKKVLEIKFENISKIQEELDKTYKSRNHFLAYEVGVWISAYARYDLHRALSVLKTDAVYWDTDSCKFINRNNYRVFEQLNKEKLEQLLKAGYTYEEVSPKDIKGIRHTLGYWDEEYPDGVIFKTFGAKKYFYQENGKNHITVAGLNKKTACKYLEETLNGDVTNIELGQKFPLEYSGRTFSIYSEEGFEINICGETLSEKSFVSIVPTTYELSDVEDHLLYILLSKENYKERG